MRIRVSNRAVPYCYLLLVTLSCPFAQSAESTGVEEAIRTKPTIGIRVATFNAALNRSKSGGLTAALSKRDDPQAQKIAAIIQLIRPDVLLLNEFDYDPAETAVTGFQRNYLNVDQFGQRSINYPYYFSAAVNTGILSGYDLNRDGAKDGPADAFGYGEFPGQYGMVVFSRFPIVREQVRTFQKFLWKDMPEMQIPEIPETKESYYSSASLDALRLSSKSHWDIPLQVSDRVLHVLAAHPTPPVFDGPEDRNGKRNHDEIRFWSDYIAKGRGDYIYTDGGEKGGLPAEASFVILGDMNADPVDGDSANNAIGQLLSNTRISSCLVPASRGGTYFAELQGRVNREHRGVPAYDTGDFNDYRVGNLRLDYVLPSEELEPINGGVFWPKPNELGTDWIEASDHRLVWLDLRFIE